MTKKQTTEQDTDPLAVEVIAASILLLNEALDLLEEWKRRGDCGASVEDTRSKTDDLLNRCGRGEMERRSRNSS